MPAATLFLLDGHALAYRAYFAFINANLRNSEGLPTGPVLGFANTIVKLLESEKPTHIAVAWDTHAPTFRHDMDAAYKAQRPPQPDDLRTAIPLIKEMLGYFNIPSLELDGYEADDIIGTLATTAIKQDVHVYMVTPDKDFMQLVTDNINLYKPLNNGEGFDIIDRQGVIKYFGVPPEQVVDVLTLIGDASDNIPGVPGIGKKTAPGLILEYGTIEHLIAAAPDIKSKRVREGLMENHDRIKLSKQMIVIHTSVPGFDDWSMLGWKGPDTAKLTDFFGRMQFRTLTRKYAGGSVLPPVAKSITGQGDLFGSSESGQAVSQWKTYDETLATYTLVDSIEKINQLSDELKQADVICFDTETTGVDATQADIIGIALSTQPNTAWYVPLAGPKSVRTGMFSLLKEVLENEQSLKVAHNFKYDFMILKREGIQVSGPVFDTMLAAYLIDSAQPLNMDALSIRHLNYQPIPIESLIGSGKAQKNMLDAPLDEVAIYAAEDADITFRLYQIFNTRIREDGLQDLAENIEFPLARVLGEMELNGIRVDAEKLAVFSKALTGDILQIEKKIYETCGVEFNINSTQQLGDILFNRMKLPAGKKTSTGKFSTSEEVLQQLSVHYEIAAHVLDYRTLAKLKSTYVDALPKLINPLTGRIHTSFNQNVAATGRLSSSNPNLQNIPIRTDRGREIRKAFIAEKGYVLISADYSQIELRVIAAISGDDAMKQAFILDEDIHARTAKEIFGLDSLDDVDREYRRKAKEVNFGIPYGVSAFGLAQRLGMGNTEAKAIIDAYFDRFPHIKVYMDETIAFARSNGYVKTLDGRRRYIPDIHASNTNVRGFAERTAINTPIQGTAADLIKRAMIGIQRHIDKEHMASRMLLQVHDELVFEVPEAEKAAMSDIIRSEMEGAMDIGVPLKVEMGTAANWLDAH